MPTPFTVAMPVYDGVDLLDIAGAREMFSWVGLSGGDAPVELYTVAGTPTVTTQDGLTFIPDRSFDERAVRRPSLLWVPGGSLDALSRLLAEPDAPFFRYILRAAEHAEIVASVCEGALLLAKTGLLDGYRATTHWNFYPCLETYADVEVVPPTGPPDNLQYPRYIRDRDRITGGGISSGMDEALAIIEWRFGREVASGVRAVTQYFPDPPVPARLGVSAACPIAMPDTGETSAVAA